MSKHNNTTPRSIGANDAATVTTGPQSEITGNTKTKAGADVVTPPNLQFSGPVIEKYQAPKDGDGKYMAFPVWRPSQFLAWSPESSAAILEGYYLEHGEWTSLLGVGGLGKSRLALRLAIDQILGRTWCGLETCGEPKKWLFLSNENSIRRWKDDLFKMTKTLSSREKQLVEENVRALALLPSEDVSLFLGDGETEARLAATIEEHRPGILVFDPFADMVEGDENSTKDMVETMRKLRKLIRRCAPNAAVLIIHHARTGAGNIVQAGDNYSQGNFGRGAKAFFSKMRCEVQLVPADRDDSSRLVLMCGKSNNGPKFSPRAIVMNSETFDYEVDETFDIDAWRADVNGKRGGSTIPIGAVVEAVKKLAPSAGQEAKMKDILVEVDHLGATRRTVERVVKKAIEVGYLRPGSKQGFYRLGSKSLPNVS